MRGHLPRLTIGAALVLLALSCATEKKRPAPRPQCMRFDRVAGKGVEVECSGTDGDGDGIDDAADLCPGAPETDNGEADEDGCPDPDGDGDLIRDEEDDCPRLAGPAPTGCPSVDADKDGIADHLDSCPDAAEDLNGIDDQDGCPDGADVIVVARKDAIYIRQPIHFLKRSAMLLPDSKDLLDRVAEQLRGHKQRISRIRVVGHTDRREVPKKKAYRLSKTRARIVARYLSYQGIDKKMFEIEALGAKRPANKGRKKRDRERNQRVELTVTLRPVEGQPSDTGGSAVAGSADKPDAAVRTDTAAATTADAGTSPPSAADAGVADAATGARPDAAPAPPLADPGQPPPTEEGVEAYDEGEDWDEEFLEDNWDDVFIKKDK